MKRAAATSSAGRNVQAGPTSWPFGPKQASAQGVVGWNLRRKSMATALGSMFLGLASGGRCEFETARLTCHVFSHLPLGQSPAESCWGSEHRFWAWLWGLRWPEDRTLDMTGVVPLLGRRSCFSGCTVLEPALDLGSPETYSARGKSQHGQLAGGYGTAQGVLGYFRDGAQFCAGEHGVQGVAQTEFWVRSRNWHRYL
jgi:hypothetical protein